MPGGARPALTRAVGERYDGPHVSDAASDLIDQAMQLVRDRVASLKVLSRPPTPDEEQHQHRLEAALLHLERAQEALLPPPSDAEAELLAGLESFDP